MAVLDEDDHQTIIIMPAVIQLWEEPLLSHVFPYLTRSDWSNMLLVKKAVRDAIRSHTNLGPPWPKNCQMPSPRDDDDDDEEEDPFPMAIYRIDWSPDGRSFAYLDEYRPRGFFVFSQDVNEQPMQWRATDPVTWALAFSPNGKRLVTIGEDLHLRVYDSTNNFRLIQDWDVDEKIDYTSSAFPRVIVSPNSKLVALHSNGLVVVLDIDTGNEVRSASLPQWASTFSLVKLTFSPDSNNLMLVRNSIFIHIWRLDHPGDPLFSPIIQEQVYPIDDSPYHQTLSSDGTRLAVIDYHMSVKIGAIESGSLALVKSLDGLLPSIGCHEVSFSCDNNFVAVGGNDENNVHVQIWKIDDGICTQHIRIPYPQIHDSNFRPTNPGPSISDIIFSPDGDRILVSIREPSCIFMRSTRLD